MKTLTALLTLCAYLLLGPAAWATTIIITVGDNFYSPQAVTIHPGDIVTWQYQGGVNSHPTASDNGAWATFTINSANVSKSLPFAAAGSFPYHCQFHGAAGSGMFGVITVAAALAVPPTQLAAAVLQVYPNPARDVVMLKLDRSQVRGHSSVQLLDVLGSVVRSREVRPEAAGQELALEVADLPAGIYFYRLLVNREGVATQRLVLVR